MPAEVPEDRVPLEARPFEVPAQDDRPQVVIDDLVGDAAEVFEGLLMGPEERRHLLVGCRHGVHPPAVAQRQDEEVNLHSPAGDDRPALPPVGLALLSRRRLEPHRRFDGRLFPQRRDEPPHDIVAAAIAIGPQLLIDRHGAIADRRDPPLDPLLEARQEPTPFGLTLIRPGRLLPEQPPNGPDVQAQGPGDLLLGLPELESAVDLVPHVGFDHVLASRSLDREQAYSL